MFFRAKILLSSLYSKWLRIVLLFLLILCTDALSQSSTVLVNPKYQKAPSFIAKSPVKLAQYLTENDTSEFQKALNIYTWMVNNIQYDVKALRRIKTKVYTPKQTLKRKSGTCYQYSTLFTALCENAGISSREIIGYSRGFEYHEGDRFYEVDHSWNGVRLDSLWYLVDATWGSGVLYQKKRWFKELQFRWFKNPYVNNKYAFRSQPNYQYFLANPKALISDHLPADPNWQLLEFPISMSTFESSGWSSYPFRIDSVYQKQIDSVEYVRRLNAYLSDLQYLQVTAKQGHSFNPRNSKLVGFSSYSMAKSFARALGATEERLEAYRQAVHLQNKAIVHLKRHQKVAISVSREVTKNLKKRIENELTKPVASRIKMNDRENKVSENFLSKEQKIVSSYESKIVKLQHAISGGFRPFATPIPSRSEKLAVVEKNRLKIENALLKVSNYQDSVMTISKRLSAHICDRNPIQMDIVEQYPKMISYSIMCSSSVAHNLGISPISYSVHGIDSIGQIIDGLTTAKMKFDLEIRKERSAIKQLQSLSISLLTKIQKLIIQNCQLSKNKICDMELYNASNQQLKFIYETKKELEMESLEMAKYDGMIYRDLQEITEEVQELLTINSDFIALFREVRLSGILFKLNRSIFQANQLIGDSQKSLRKVTIEQTKLRKDMRINQR